MPMTDTGIRMIVNGKSRQLDSDPGRTLLSALREDLGLTGTKDGCSQGDCGACVVLVDGQLIENLHVANAKRLVAQAEAIEALEGSAAAGG